MYPDCARSRTLYEGLAKIDRDLADEARIRGCPRCGQALDFSRWRRKPRGSEPVPAAIRWRHGLCCRRCRRRVLPPSALFLDRKVYWGAVVLISVAARQRRLVGATADNLRRMFGVSGATLKRWLAFFRDEFPQSRRWQQVRGRVAANVRDGDLPDALLAQFDHSRGGGEETLAACLRFLASGSLQAC